MKITKSDYKKSEIAQCKKNNNKKNSLRRLTIISSS